MKGIRFTLHIGNREIGVDSLAHAVEVYSARRDASGEGASTWPNGTIAIGDKAYRISYNGTTTDLEAL